MPVLALGDVELEQDVADVGLHRALAETQPPGDGGIGQAFSHQLKDLALALGELSYSNRALAPMCRSNRSRGLRRMTNTQHPPRRRSAMVLITSAVGRSIRRGSPGG
jgi:hypothetical protein